MYHYHNFDNHSIHYLKALDLDLKRRAQKEFDRRTGLISATGTSGLSGLVKDIQANQYLSAEEKKELDKKAESLFYEKLNENGYILPGLGDAGDRVYGTK